MLRMLDDHIKNKSKCCIFGTKQNPIGDEKTTANHIRNNYRNIAADKKCQQATRNSITMQMYNTKFTQCCAWQMNVVHTKITS